MLIIFLIIRITLAMLRLLLQLGVSSRSSLTAFECGFFRVGIICSSFRLHSYVVLLVFVVFDLELCMLLGFLLIRGSSLWLFFLYMFFVFGTYYLEVVCGRLS